MAGSVVKDVKKNTVVFLRHGESEWIQKNIYCGWYDSDISREGEREAEKAGKILKENGYVFDEIYTSVLRRAEKTVNILLEILKQPDIPVYKSWRLNSRHYGAFTGLSKGESIRKYGEDKIKLWRRSYDIPPPEITKENPYYKRILENPIYKGGPTEEEFPITESLQQAIERTLPYWHDTIAPRIEKGKRILIVGHMSSLRAIIKTIDKISDEKIMEYNIPTGTPFIYELTTDMKPIISLKFLGDTDYVKKANEILVTPGRGFEKPKRSKPSVLEVYDYVSKKTDPLPAVQSMVEHNTEEINERKEPQTVETKIDTLDIKSKEEIIPKIQEQQDEKLDVIVGEIVETNVDGIPISKLKEDNVEESEIGKVVDLITDNIIEPREDEIENFELKDVEITEPSVDETKEKVIEIANEQEVYFVQPIENITDQFIIAKGAIIEKEQQLADDIAKSVKSLETFGVEVRDDIDDRDNTIFTASHEAKKPEKVSSEIETILNEMCMPQDTSRGVISVVNDEPRSIEDKSKEIATSLSIISKENYEVQELLTNKESAIGSYKEIEEKLSNVTSRITPSHVAAIGIKEQETKEKQPAKVEEKVEIDKKGRAQL